jgi:hypothetical protein
MPKLAKVEFLGGPMDGKVIAVPNSVDAYHCCLNPMIIHLYVRDEQHTGKGFRVVFRHTELMVAKRD